MRQCYIIFMKLMQSCILAVCLGVLMSVFSGAAKSVILEQQALGFGSFALRDNNSTHDMEILATGGFNVDPAYVILTSGQRARFRVQGFPPSTMLIITVVSSPMTIGGGGGGEPFSLVNFHTSPANPVTNGGGNAQFFLGTTLRTSGTSTMYSDGAYEANATVSVNF